MKLLRDTLDKLAPLFEEGGKFHKFEAFFEAPDTLLYTPGKVTKSGAHVRDSIDLKRMMITVVLALLPCVLMAMWNTGHQAFIHIDSGAGVWRDDWNTWLYQLVMGTSAHDPDNILQCLLYGGAYFVPVFAVTGIIGGNIEMVTALLRKHEVNEGFLVTLFLFPLICPPTIPLWQVALGITFGVVVGKEMFGGTGMNVLNPALTGRAFLFFAYPAQISGEKVWTAAQTAGTDGYSGAELEAILLAASGLAADHDSDIIGQNHIDQAVRDVIPSRDTRMLEFMEMLAVFESSAKRMLPDRFKDMSTEDVQERLDQLRAMLGRRAQ